MKRRCGMLVLALALVAGCGGKGGGPGLTTAPPAGPPPPGSVTESEPNDFAAQTLGALSTIDFTVTGATASQSDVDLYSVTASATTGLLVNLNWNNGNDLELAISNANGIFVRHVDGSGRPETCTLIGLPAGTYTVRVGSHTNAATTYSLIIGQR